MTTGIRVQSERVRVRKGTDWEKRLARQGGWRRTERERLAAQRTPDAAAYWENVQAKGSAYLSAHPADSDEWVNLMVEGTEDPYCHLNRDIEEREAINDLLGRRE